MTAAIIIVLHLKMPAHLPVPAASLHFDVVWHSSLGVAQIGSDIPISPYTSWHQDHRRHISGNMRIKQTRNR